MIDLRLGDCLEILPTLESESVDAVITDPPYGIGYKSGRVARPNGMPRELSASFGKDKYIGGWMSLAAALMKSNALMYVFVRWDTAHRFKADGEQQGLVCIQRLIWDKCHWGMGDLRYYGSQTEDALLFRKGTPALNWPKRKGNIWRYPSKAYFPEGRFDHPAQKPLGVIAEWIEDATMPGDIVLDPFMGSGTTGAACVQTGRSFIGVEINPEYYHIAEERIRQAQPRLI